MHELSHLQAYGTYPSLVNFPIAHHHSILSLYSVIGSVRVEDAHN